MFFSEWPLLRKYGDPSFTRLKLLMITSRVLFDMSQVSIYSPCFFKYIHKFFVYGSQVVQIIICFIYIYLYIYIYFETIRTVSPPSDYSALNTILLPCEVDFFLNSQSSTLVTRSTYWSASYSYITDFTKTRKGSFIDLEIIFVIILIT